MTLPVLDGGLPLAVSSHKSGGRDLWSPPMAEEPEDRYRSLEEITAEVKALEKQMREAARALEFEKAAEIRDRVKALRAREFGLK